MVRVASGMVRGRVVVGDDGGGVTPRTQGPLLINSGTDSCYNKVSADQNRMTVARAQKQLTEVTCFLS